MSAASLDDRQLAVVLQAIAERAKELLDQRDDFLAFGTRCKADGTIEFVDLGERDPGAFEAVYQGLGSLLAAEAGTGTLVAAAVASHVSLPHGAGNAVIVQLETKGAAHSIALPYRETTEGHVEYGKMIPQQAEPAIFAKMPGAGNPDITPEKG